MTIDELYERACAATKQEFPFMTLILPTKRPKNFPRGELMCVNGRDKVYSVNAWKVLAWLRRNGYEPRGDSNA